MEVLPSISEVEIKDDDCMIMFYHNNMVDLYLIFVCFAVILVGFEQVYSSVEEDIGSFELYIRIFTDPAFFPSHISTDFSLNLISIPRTAGTYSYKHHVLSVLYSPLILTLFR